MAETTGLKTKFYRSEDGTVWEEIAQVANITPPQPEREVAEVDELDPPGGIRKKLAGIIDPGEVSVTLNFDPSNQGHLKLDQDFRDGVARQYRIKLPNDYGWTFTGIVTSYAPQEISSDEVVQVEVTISLTGVYQLGQITS